MNIPSSLYWTRWSWMFTVGATNQLTCGNLPWAISAFLRNHHPAWYWQYLYKVAVDFFIVCWACWGVITDRLCSLARRYCLKPAKGLSVKACFDKLSMSRQPAVNAQGPFITICWWSNPIKFVDHTPAPVGPFVPVQINLRFGLHA